MLPVTHIHVNYTHSPNPTLIRHVTPSWNLYYMAWYGGYCVTQHSTYPFTLAGCLIDFLLRCENFYFMYNQIDDRMMNTNVWKRVSVYENILFFLCNKCYSDVFVEMVVVEVLCKIRSITNFIFIKNCVVVK